MYQYGLLEADELDEFPLKRAIELNHSRGKFEDSVWVAKLK